MMTAPARSDVFLAISPESVAALEVADRAFGPTRALVRAARGGLLAAGDEDRRGRERGVGLLDGEAAVDGGLTRADRHTRELGDGRGSNSSSLGEPIFEAAGRIRPRAPRRVFSASSKDVAELVALAEFSVAGRARGGDRRATPIGP